MRLFVATDALSLDERKEMKHQFVSIRVAIVREWSKLCLICHGALSDNAMVIVILSPAHTIAIALLLGFKNVLSAFY